MDAIRLRNPFGVCLNPFGFVLGSVLGSVLGFVWGQFGVRLGSVWAWTDLEALLGPTLAPWWAHAGPLLGAVGRLGSFLAVHEVIWKRS